LSPIPQDFMSSSSAPDSPDVAPLAYHELSKHRPNAYAPGPATLDWDAQPNPFRHFTGAPRIELPLTAGQVRMPYSALLAGRAPPANLNGPSIGALLELGLGISAWKSNGVDRWAVRCNPSSGNLHPVEAYLTLPRTELGPAGLYHYEALGHGLELRCAFDPRLADRLPGAFPAHCLLVGLSLIPWRESWKYGVRAWRYCQLDLGHAVAALGYAAGCLGWQTHEQTGWGADELAALLGLDRAEDYDRHEPEYPATLLMLGPVPAELPPPADLRNTMPHQQWHGVANRLEPHHLYRWDAVDAMARNCVTSRQGPPPAAPGLPTSPPPPSDPPVIEVILQRRSTRAFDPRQAVSAECFYRLRSYCRPRPGLPPWDRRQAALRLHLLLFVHRVEGLPSGLYFLAEHPDAVPELRTRSRPELAWEPAPGCPSDLSCYRLLTANARKAAMHLACHQQICADSAFALASWQTWTPPSPGSPAATTGCCARRAAPARSSTSRPGRRTSAPAASAASSTTRSGS
jgi:SagB-type dehydrogenase family enzyme